MNVLLGGVTNLTDSISGYVAGVWVPFTKTDACETVSPKCPLGNGVSATYTYSLSISKDYPTVSDIQLVIMCASKIMSFQITVPVKSDMTESNKNICACFEIQGKIV